MTFILFIHSIFLHLKLELLTQMDLKYTGDVSLFLKRLIRIYESTVIFILVRSGPIYGWVYDI